MAKQKKIRVSIPAEIERLVKVEAGFKCSMPQCNCTSSLEIHHINEDPGENDIANLLLLCAVCHGRVTKGEIDRRACQLIKQIIAANAPTATQVTKDDLEQLKHDVVNDMAKLVGRQDTPQVLNEEEKGKDKPNEKVDTAAAKAIIMERAGIALPIDLLRPLAHKLYVTGDIEQALAVQMAVTALKGASAVDYCNLGVLLDDQGRQKEAEEAYRKALEFDPELAEAWSNLGVLLNDQGRQKEAEEAYRKALEFDPELAKAWYNLGVLLHGQGRQKEAEEAYRKALEFDPELAKAWYNLGVLLHGQGRKKEAVEAYRKALEFDPENAKAWFNLGVLLVDQGRQREAEEAYRTAANITPNNADICNDFAYFLWHSGKPDDAEEQVHRALEINPHHSYANATLGLLSFEKNELDKGRRQYENAIKYNPDDLPLQQKYHYEYGRALARNGHKLQAHNELEMAKNIDADYISIKDIEAEIAMLN